MSAFNTIPLVDWKRIMWNAQNPIYNQSKEYSYTRKKSQNQSSVLRRYQLTSWVELLYYLEALNIIFLYMSF